MLWYLLSIDFCSPSISHLRYPQYWDDEFPIKTTEAYLEPYQTSMIGVFCKNSQQLQAVNNYPSRQLHVQS